MLVGVGVAEAGGVETGVAVVTGVGVGTEVGAGTGAVTDAGVGVNVAAGRAVASSSGPVQATPIMTSPSSKPAIEERPTVLLFANKLVLLIIP